ncbi:hypothetical protein AMIS_40620 [Actinoplanes missouriensis 431]|uniref:Uncharacterized protein n=1 Tax=Actinoplanes missouriensis (strain ATCC 14538 / DSM 43046 / CBS 188.64 / JCM 3121 / NBRC 102363 / NCIMB 12654 / NRRL B-3342 / UNCC 431) TaxID=512565 RepID=I0H8E5_ACTM4|nr:hypothetical protein [Actinoplanes missouriensis]BAL89282.1 hypothetical protein AMIS_40620 [Actinoplanes missouriensis 431]
MNRISVAAALLLVSAVALAALSWVRVGGSVEQVFQPGAPAVLDVPGGEFMVWSAGAVDVRCEPADIEGPWSARSVRDEDLTVEGEGRTWRGALLVTAEPPGTYEITCTGDAALALGDPPLIHDFSTQLYLRFGAALLALAGIVTGLAGAITAARRRKRVAA